MITERLLELREKMGISQNEISRRLGIARTTYASYEQGKREPDIEMLKKLSELHGVKVSHLIGENKKENAEAFPKSKLDLAVEQIERDFDITITDDPDIMEALESYLRTLGKMKKK